MKKIICLLCVIIFSMFIIVGCNKTSSKSYTFNVSTGEKVEIQLDTSSGYNIKQNEGVFYILNNKDEQVLEGKFLKQEGFDLYKKAISEPAEGLEVIENTDKNLMWLYSEGDSSQINQVIKISNKTNIITTSNKNKEENKKIMKLIKFEVK